LNHKEKHGAGEFFAELEEGGWRRIPKQGSGEKKKRSGTSNPTKKKKEEKNGSFKKKTRRGKELSAGPKGLMFQGKLWNSR